MTWTQATTTLAEASGWGPSQIIALTAVLVTGLSIYFTYRGSNRRLESEERRHTERLANERRLLHERNAAKAYMAAEKVQRRIQWDEVAEAALFGHKRLPQEHGAIFTAAAKAITEAKAYAWRDEMAVAAGRVNTTLADLESQANVSVKALAEGANDREPGSGKRANEKFEERRSAYGRAIEDFRKEITK